MSEKIDPIGHDWASSILLKAIVGLGDDWDKKIYPPDGIRPGVDTNPEVQLIVNGVEVPYTATINDMMLRIANKMDEEAKNKALNLIRGKYLEDVYNIREEHERKVVELWEEYETKLRTALDAWDYTYHNSDED